MNRSPRTVFWVLGSLEKRGRCPPRPTSRKGCNCFFDEAGTYRAECEGGGGGGRDVYCSVKVVGRRGKGCIEKSMR